MKEFESFTETNKDIKLDKVPERIVVLGYPAYDTIKTLGLENNIVATPKEIIPNYIDEVNEDAKDVESLHEPNIEKIKEANPDLIIGTDRASGSIEKLEKIAPVFKYATTNAAYWDSFTEINQELGRVLDKEALAAELIDEIDQEAEKIRQYNQEHQERTLLLMLSKGSLKAFDGTSRFAIMSDVFNFKPVREDFKSAPHGEEISYDELVDVDPERIFVIDRTEAITDDEKEDKDLLDSSKLKETEAAKNNKLTKLTADLWYLGGGGLDSALLQVQEVAKALGV